VTQSRIHEHDPGPARHAWNEANLAHKLATIRHQQAKQHADEAINAIKRATEHQTLTGATFTELATLAQKAAARMQALDQAKAQKDRAAKELKHAWKAWEPFANEEAQQLTGIPRTTTVIEATRRKRKKEAQNAQTQA
jgi:hypothetical protein